MKISSLMRRAPLFLLAVVSAIAPASLHLLVPALPLLTSFFQSSPSSVQLVLTLFLVGIAAGQLVYGPISDRFGRRPVLLLGLLLYLVGTAVGGSPCTSRADPRARLAGLGRLFRHGAGSWGLGLSAWSMFMPMALSSIGNGMSQPPAMAGGLSIYPRIAGAASGLMGFLQMMIAACGTYLIGQLPQNTGAWTVLVVWAFMLLAFLCSLFALRLPAAATRAVPAPSRRRVLDWRLPVVTGKMCGPRALRAAGRNEPCRRR
jgi:MFS family permease